MQKSLKVVGPGQGRLEVRMDEASIDEAREVFIQAMAGHLKTVQQFGPGALGLGIFNEMERLLTAARTLGVVGDFQKPEWKRLKRETNALVALGAGQQAGNQVMKELQACGISANLCTAIQTLAAATIKNQNSDG